MGRPLPALTQFRIEARDSGLVQLVSECPGGSMSVFPNTANHELGTVAEWLHGADARGVGVRLGQTVGFCAGAELTGAWRRLRHDCRRAEIRSLRHRFGSLMALRRSRQQNLTRKMRADGL